MLSMPVLTGIAPVQVSKAKVEVLTSGWRRATVGNAPHDHGENMARPTIQLVPRASLACFMPTWCCVWHMCGICMDLDASAPHLCWRGRGQDLLAPHCSYSAAVQRCM